MKAKPHEDMELTFHFNDPYIRSQICLTALCFMRTHRLAGACVVMAVMMLLYATVRRRLRVICTGGAATELLNLKFIRANMSSQISHKLFIASS